MYTHTHTHTHTQSKKEIKKENFINLQNLKDKRLASYTDNKNGREIFMKFDI
jgi:hypothetical protein